MSTSMKNIHLLPILQPSRLIKSKINDTIVLEPINVTNDTRFWEYLNISITNDEEIKEENLTKSIYVIDVQNGNIGKLTCKNSFFKGSSKLIEIKWKNKQNIWNYNHIREIILTTDQDLIKDGVQAIDDDFLEWFVKNPSCEYIRVKDIKTIPSLQLGRPNGHLMYEIIIPKEEPKRKIDSCYNFDMEIGCVQDICRCEQEEPKQDFILVKEECSCIDECLYYLSKQCKHLKEEPKQDKIMERFIANAKQEETLEEAAKEFFRKFKHTHSPVNYHLALVEFAKWQQEQDKNKYSEEDLREAFRQGQDNMDYSEIYGWDSKLTEQEWFEKFKNK